MFICAAGDIHGAMDRLYDDVLVHDAPASVTIASVYKIDSGMSLPAPVAIIVRNLDGGGMAVHVANFMPTQEE